MPSWRFLSCVLIIANVSLGSFGKLTTTSIVRLEENENLHAAPLMHRHLSSFAGTTDSFFFGFENNNHGRRKDLTNKKEAF